MGGIEPYLILSLLTGLDSSLEHEYTLVLTTRPSVYPQRPKAAERGLTVHVSHAELSV
jgi:hypothetical protein